MSRESDKEGASDIETEESEQFDISDIGEDEGDIEKLKHAWDEDDVKEEDQEDFEISDDQIENEEEQRQKQQQEIENELVNGLFELCKESDQQEIIEQDIPERLQIQYKDRKIPDNTELVEETYWIYEKINIRNQLQNLSSLTIEKYRKKILLVLDYLRVQHYEKNEITPELSLRDLWYIYDMDKEWHEIDPKRKQLLEKLATIELNSKRFMLDDEIRKKLNQAFSMKDLDNIEIYAHYCAMKYSKKGGKANKPRLAIKLKIDQFIRRAAISPGDLAFNLQQTKSDKIHLPRIIRISPERLADRYVNQDEDLVKNKLSVMKTACEFMSREVQTHPMLRECLYKIYQKYVLLSTEPTVKGKKQIDVYNQDFRVKRIVNRKISHISGSIWLRIQDCLKRDLITLTFKIPGSKHTKSNFILNLLKKNYCLQNFEEANERVKKFNVQWNTLRGEALRIMLKRMTPVLQKKLETRLTQCAQRSIMKQCYTQFRYMLTKSCYTTRKNKGIVFGVVSEAISEGKIIIVVVDEYGEHLESLELEQISTKNTSKTDVELIQKFELEKQQVKAFLIKYAPDALFFGQNCLYITIVETRIQNLVKDVAQQIKEDRAMKHSYHPKIIQGEMKVQKLLFPDNKLEQAISLCRYYQSPMTETLQLFEDNKILQLIFHPLQGRINQRKLKNAFQQGAIETVAELGINLNLALEHPHLSAPLQFICGFGAIKAKHFLQTFEGKLESRSQLEDIIGEKIYQNSSAFLKIGGENPLDASRIHPRWYKLAQKVARDALGKPHDPSLDVINEINKNPRVLKKLDFKHYVKYLQKKGIAISNINILLELIIRELSRPFHDPRGRFKPVQKKVLFFQLCHETRESFKRESLLKCKITGIFRYNMSAITDRGMKVQISVSDLISTQKDPLNYLKRSFHVGQIVRTRIRDFDYQKLMIKVTLNQKALNDHWRYVKTAYAKDELATLKIVEVEDFPRMNEHVLDEDLTALKLKHPRYKEMSLQNARFYLKDKPIGEFVIRSSTRGYEWLSVTWKIFENSYINLMLKEERTYDRITYKMGKRRYLSLDDFINKYIENCNNQMQMVTTNKKFMDGTLDYIKSVLIQDKTANPNMIPYYLGISEAAPSYVVLMYIYQQLDVQIEYIKIEHNGLRFHGRVFQNISKLIRYFKTAFATPTYQEFIRKNKTPIQIIETNTDPVIITEGIDGKMNAKEMKSKGKLITEWKKDTRPSYMRRFEGQKRCDFCHRHGHDSTDCYVSKKYGGNKSCSNCGKKGHFRSECDEPTRKERIQLCFNCGDKGHFSNECPKPRRERIKRCYNCQEIGHTAVECQNEKKERILRPCYICKEDGHTSRECPTRHKDKTCFKCGKEGHIIATCPLANHNKDSPNNSPQQTAKSPTATTTRRFHSHRGRSDRNRNKESSNEEGGDYRKTYRRDYCKKCGTTGHMTFECRESDQQNLDPRRTYKKNITCFKCGLQGHSNTECPLLKDISQQVQLPNKKSSSSICYRCGQTGHYSSDCPLRNESGSRMDRSRSRDVQKQRKSMNGNQLLLDSAQLQQMQMKLLQQMQQTKSLNAFGLPMGNGGLDLGFGNMQGLNLRVDDW